MAALTRSKGMHLSVAKHEVAHLCGAAIGYLGGGAGGGINHLCQHPRYHDASIFFGYDASAQQGEFAIVLSKHSTVNGTISDAAIDAVRRSSALAPIGLAHDPRRVIASLKSAKHVFDLVTDFSDVLSPEDKVHAIKGKLTIDRHEDLVGIVAYDAARAVAPNRIDGIVKLYQRYEGFGSTIALRQFISRELANDILAEALKMSKTLFAIAEF